MESVSLWAVYTVWTLIGDLYAGMIKEVTDSFRKWSNEGNNVFFFYILPNFVWAMKLQKSKNVRFKFIVG
jgi:hypothetical protein